MRYALILFTRQRSEDFEVIGSEAPTDRQLFDQLQKEFDEIDLTLLFVNTGGGEDEYQIIAAHRTEKPLTALRDRLQIEYDHGAAGQFMIVAFAQGVEPTVVSSALTNA